MHTKFYQIPMKTRGVSATTTQAIAGFKKAGLWPIEHTRAYYRKVAATGSSLLCRVLILKAARRL